MRFKNKHLYKIILIKILILPLFLAGQEEQDTYITFGIGIEQNSPIIHFNDEYDSGAFGFNMEAFVGRDIGMPVFVGITNSFLSFESLSKRYDLFTGDFLIPVKHTAKSKVYNLNLALRLYPIEFSNWLIHVDTYVGLRHTFVRSNILDLEQDADLESYKDIKDYTFSYGAGAGINYVINEYVIAYISMDFSSSLNTEFYRLVPDLTSIDEDDPFLYYEAFDTSIDLLSTKAGIKFIF